jgi:hypothetical protein
MYEASVTVRDREGAGQLASNEGVIGYDGEHYVLLGRQVGMEEHVLVAGDVLELGGNGRHAVRVASGGYRGWYYITADGQQTRFALCMQARLLTSPA